MKDGYNEIISNPDDAVSMFLEIAFPEVYGRELLSFYGHFKLMAGSPKANIVVLPDLVDGISTKASTMQYIQRNIEPTDAVLFVNDAINPDANSAIPPQSFVCKKVFYRAPSYLNSQEFISNFWNKYLSIRSRIRKLEACQCFRLALDHGSPLNIKRYIDQIASSRFPPGRYFVVMDQLQMPGQQNAQSTVKDWNDVFGDRGYQLLIDLYANTAR